MSDKAPVGNEAKRGPGPTSANFSQFCSLFRFAFADTTELAPPTTMLGMQAIARWTATTRHATCARRYASNITSESLYELRTYSIKPEHYGKFVELTNKHISKRLGYSDVIGYWASEIGGVNQTVHIWKYDGYNHRAQVRKSLIGDAAWMTDYMGAMRPMLDSQVNMTMRVTGLVQSGEIVVKDPVVERPMEGFYELYNLTLKPATQPEEFLGTLAPVLETHPMISIWESDVGPLNEIVMLSYFNDIGQRKSFWDDCHKLCPLAMTYVRTGSTKILQPLAFSPLK